YPHLPCGPTCPHPLGGSDGTAVTYLAARLIQIGGHETCDFGEGLVKVLAVRIQKSQLHNAASAIALTGAVVAGDGGELESFGHKGSCGEIAGVIQLHSEVAFAQQVE